MTNHSSARRRTVIAGIAFGLVVAACAKPPPPPPPTVVKGTLAAAANVNPDGSGRASPIVVRVLELRSTATFDNADFFAVWDKPRETLAADLVASEEYELRPGERHAFERTLAPDVKFVAVIAAYRDLERAAWRAKLAVVPATTQPVTIALDARAVAMSRK